MVGSKKRGGKWKDNLKIAPPKESQTPEGREANSTVRLLGKPSGRKREQLLFSDVIIYLEEGYGASWGHRRGCGLCCDTDNRLTQGLQYVNNRLTSVSCSICHIKIKKTARKKLHIGTKIILLLNFFPMLLQRSLMGGFGLPRWSRLILVTFKFSFNPINIFFGFHTVTSL